MGKTIAKVKINSDRIEDFKQAVTEFATDVRTEKGCLFYELYQLIEEEETFFFVEEWKNEEDLQAHFKTPHFTAFIKKMEGMEAGGAVPLRWERVV